MENLDGAAFGIEGDVEAVRRAPAVGALHGRARSLTLTAEKMALYHAGAVIASNYVVALADVARSLLVAAGIPEDEALPALLPLMTSAVRNLVEVGLPSALTGPVARGDVARSSGTWRRWAPARRRTWTFTSGLGRQVLRIARNRVPDLDPKAVSRLATLFGP